MKSRWRWWLTASLVLAAFGAWWNYGRERALLPRSSLSLSAVRLRAPSPVNEPSAREAPELPASLPLVAPAERHWHPRDPAEWQGMLVDMDFVPPCESPAGCGLARACKAGKCVACERDSDCAPAEACALDHCVASELAGCRSRADCPRESVCVLSGYSATARGNQDMRSGCLNPLSGAGRIESPSGPPPVDTRTSLPDDDLLRRARAAADAK